MIYKDDEHEYTYRNGELVEILTTKRNSLRFPVVSMTREGGTISFHTGVGAYNLYHNSPYDLILIPEHDYPIDAKVLVWDGTGDNASYKRKRNFAGTDPATGRPMAWDDGKTEWTAGAYKTSWDYCKLAE